ncbi:methyltransferase-like protein 17, mitochondrial [Thalassophryne amazonica]|uniref:methyltransferase-like protein 17, mitochondrial n=1 Tax=Thalassophryne amazonica TaxID=390379 RepID=UPI0014722E71|nr:methyltransferase-like protein 17, mitochondrial [Thalassophryne amazonica]
MFPLSCATCALCRRPVSFRTISRSMSASANPQVQTQVFNGEKPRRHPGLTNLKTLHLPVELQKTAQFIIQRAVIKQLPERADSFTNFLWSRKRAVEDSDLQQKAKSLENELWLEALQKGGDIDDETLNDRITKKVLSELRRTTYHWTPMKYDEELSMLYMAARLAGGYAAVMRALNEIKKRDPSFAPYSLLDFGSGLGTVVWAAHQHWGDTLKEKVCVDSSGHMNTLAERLLKGDDKQAELSIKHVYFRQFLPVSPKVQFDLVTAAFTLSEIPYRKDREEAIFTLWRKTSSYLVLVENGTKEGHQILMEARDTLLKKQEKIIHDTRAPSVFAPCPHELTCPKLMQEHVVPCNFQQHYHPLPLPGRRDRQTEKFSYLIVARSEPSDPSEVKSSSVVWARLIAPVLRRSRHVHCHMCCADGQLQHKVVTARKNSREVYRCARTSDWGDQLPVMKEVEGDVESDSE